MPLDRNTAGGVPAAKPDEGPAETTVTPTLRAALWPPLSVAEICTTSVPELTVSVRLASTEFTSSSVPETASVVPLWVALSWTTDSVWPLSEVSVTL